MKMDNQVVAENVANVLHNMYGTKSKDIKKDNLLKECLKKIENKEKEIKELEEKGLD